ncbi:sensor histidine kinase [Brevifollis gellanilyticus]|uniref:histidine kinase n=1 Tax=Brevifollis gellanilyticus TaxID=748831 RepID=A0A512MDD6_9BACT|nr:ATP-binding protein [Brevifollis gellanilyticus]GEP44750.1 two-component sensor histidine kinase [Brevifollis gellanilyticus]
MKSLRSRLLIGFTALLAAALMVFAVIVWLVARDTMSRDMDDFLRGKALLLGRLVPPVPLPASRLIIEPWMEQELQLQENAVVVQMFTASGTFGGRSSNLRSDIPLTEKGRHSEHPAGGVELETITLNGREWRIATHPRRERWGEPVVFYAQAAMPLDAFATRENRLLGWLIAGGVVMLLAGAVSAAVLSKLWLRSVSTLEEAARGLSNSELGKRRLFVPSDDAELAALAASFNHLLDRLESAHTTQQRFTADASHELRTPLTVLRGEIEVALRKPRTAEEYREVLVSNKEEIERLSRLTENMLALAHVDVGDAVTQRELVNVSELCAGVTSRLQSLAAERQITLQHADATTEPLSVSGDPVALDRVIFNLVENALRYSPVGEHVTVVVAKTPPWIEIQVSDTGGGIAPEHLGHLFERFYRVDKARSRSHGGSGLGLSIVKALVEAHGGMVEVESTVGRGSTFTVKLPAV